VFEHGVLRSIFGPKRNRVTREWRRLHNEQLYDPYPSPNNILVTKSRRMRCAGHVVCMEGRKGAHTALVRRPGGKRRLGKPRRGWEDNIKIHLQEVGRGGMDWNDLAQDKDRWRALLNAVMNLWVP
jgi:hypothetical protein